MRPRDLQKLGAMSQALRLALALVAGLALAGCTGETQPGASPSTPPPSPEQVLAGAAERMSKLTSYHFAGDLALAVSERGGQATPGAGPGAFSMTVPMRLEGDAAPPDRMRATIEMRMPMAMKVETVQIGTAQYLKDPVSGRWQAMDGQAGPLTGPVELMAPSDLAQYMLASARIDDGGTETMEGVSVRRLGFDIDGEKLKAAALQRQGERGNALEDLTIHQARVEVWIGEQDSHTRRFKMDLLVGAPAEAQGESRVKIDGDMYFSAFDQPVDIQAPSGVDSGAGRPAPPPL